MVSTEGSDETSAASNLLTKIKVVNKLTQNNTNSFISTKKKNRRRTKDDKQRTKKKYNKKT